MFYNTTLKTTFRSKKAAEAAMEIAVTSLRKRDSDKMHEGKLSERLIENLEIENNDLTIIQKKGCYTPEDILPVLKAFWEQIARKLPEESFTANSFTEGTYSEIKVEAAYKNGSLRISSNHVDYETTGYVCPYCGFVFAGLDTVVGAGEVICDNCGEVFTINECEVIDGEKLEEVIEIK